MTAKRITTYTVELEPLVLFVSDCTCGVVFGMPRDLEKRRRQDGKAFYCPNGHELVFTQRENLQEKLDGAKARERALQDQLEAATRDAEAQRVELARIRQRIANGVCPCCNRSFSNVRAHMESQHPSYAAPPVEPFKCSCGRRFDTFRGLRTHQGWSRPDDWARPDKSRYAAHLTVGASR